MNPIVFALRHPYTVMVAVASIVLGAALAVMRMPVDIFPDLNTPIIYVAQPYGGMDPQQMEGFLTNYYEYHFLYITGIDHVESRNIQSVALMKLYFHPGTNMAQAMAETVSYVNRARSFMPPNTVPPFIMRFDAGSLPVGYLVLESKDANRTIGEIQDEALFRVRPKFASLPGVSAPPPFGGNQRSIVIKADAKKLQSYNVSPDEVVAAIASGNQITPSGNIALNGKAPIVPVNSVVGANIKDLEKIPIRLGKDPTVYVGDIGYAVDTQDVPTGYGLVNGKRSVYILVTKRADASTLDVVREVRKNLPKMQAAISEDRQDIQVRFEFDQSPYVTNAMWGVGFEGMLGAALTGLMVLLFLRFDWRSMIVVVLNIPFALLGTIVALALTGQTINIMTLGGLALAVGILVDEATVEVENIHTQFEHTPNIARAVRAGNAQTAVPRLLAMLCVLAVFIPSFFMQGAAKALFVPLSLAVGFSMVTSYLLSSSFVPVLSVWLLRHYHAPNTGKQGWFSMARLQDGYAWVLRAVLWIRWILVPTYLLVVPGVLVLWWLGNHPGLGMEIFPKVDSGQFQLRVRAPDGTLLEDTEALARDVLDEIARQAGGEKNVDISVSLVGTASYNYPINAIFLWTSGPQEAVLRVALKRDSGIHIEDFKNQLRDELPKLKRKRAPAMKDAQLLFEAGDLVEQVMSFGSPTPVEVTVTGKNLAANIAFARKVHEQLAKIGALRDLQYGQSLAYPTLEVIVDRDRAGLSGVTAEQVGRALAPATLSSRFTTPLYWRDPKTGVGYQVQVEIPQAQMTSIADIEQMPVRVANGAVLRVEDVARVQRGTMPGQIDRYNMNRQVSLTANIVGEDLGTVARQIDEALKAAGDPPLGVNVDVLGQVRPMRQMFGGLGGGARLPSGTPWGNWGDWVRFAREFFTGLTGGLVLATVVILLLLTAYFQSIRLALVVMSTTPAVIGGVILALLLTRTTLNIQSFMGAVMAVGVAVANAILLATFAEENRRRGHDPNDAAVDGAKHRLRPILMTSCAMIAGMVPMAWGMGEGGEQTAPLGRAVIGGLAVATIATLFILPSVFAVGLAGAGTESVSLDPDDPESGYHDEDHENASTNGQGEQNPHEQRQGNEAHEQPRQSN
jgi:multidrug efflux pump subunit AcrB